MQAVTESVKIIIMTHRNCNLIRNEPSILLCQLA